MENTKISIKYHRRVVNGFHDFIDLITSTIICKRKRARKRQAMTTIKIFTAQRTTIAISYIFITEPWLKSLQLNKEPTFIKYNQWRINYFSKPYLTNIVFTANQYKLTNNTVVVSLQKRHKTITGEKSTTDQYCHVDD